MNRKYAKEYEIDPKLPKTGKKKGYRYIGEYYRYTYDTDRKKMLTVYIVLTLLLTLTWLAAGFINNPGSRFAPTGVLYAVGFFPIFYLICGVTETCRIKQTDLEHCQYDISYLRVGRSIVGMMFISGATAAADVIFMIQARKTIDVGTEILFFIIIFLAEAIAVLLRKTYKKNLCAVIKN